MTKEASGAALVLFSGGQDSTFCLAYALDQYDRVETVGFDYGQRHGIELECRQRVRSEIARRFPAWAERLGPDHVIEIASFGAIGDTALTSGAEIKMLASGLPSTFVPGRNPVFFTYAAALGSLVATFGILGAALAWVARIALDTALLFVAAARLAPQHAQALWMTAGLAAGGPVALGRCMWIEAGGLGVGLALLGC